VDAPSSRKTAIADFILPFKRKPRNTRAHIPTMPHENTHLYGPIDVKILRIRAPVFEMKDNVIVKKELNIISP
jgi:hypothetical protein